MVVEVDYFASALCVIAVFMGIVAVEDSMRL